MWAVLKENLMKKCSSALLIIVLALAFWASTVTTPPIINAFENQLQFVNCGVPEQEKLQEAGTILSNRIYEAGGETMKACLYDAFLSNVSGNLAANDIWFQFTAPGPTFIECVEPFRNPCGSEHEWLGCAFLNQSPERFQIASTFILDPLRTPTEIAGVMAHEIAHNKGHDHTDLGSGEYELTVNEQVRACVEQMTPNGTPRSAMPVEAELGPTGRMGGSPFQLACFQDAFGSGLRIGFGALVDSLALHCTDGTTQGPVGNVSHQPVDDQVCMSNEVLVGVHGRSGALIDQLGAICAPMGNLTAHRNITPVGGGGGAILCECLSSRHGGPTDPGSSWGPYRSSPGCV